VLKRAAHGIVFSRTAKEIFGKRGFQNTTYIPPPVDVQIFQPATPVRKTAFIVGYVGRLVECKGVDMILKALASLPESVTALIIGEGDARRRLESLARELGVSERVAFHNSVSPSELREMYSKMDVVVLPSRTTKYWREQFGRVLVEAMACGIPVIGSTCGEIPNVIADAGLVFKEDSVEGLRLGIERLFSNENLIKNLAERGKARVRKVFSLEVVAPQYHKLFSSL
jgi:glycosyltransferase involved in cell wall biosynthesis